MSQARKFTSIPTTNALNEYGFDGARSSSRLVCRMRLRFIDSFVVNFCIQEIVSSGYTVP